MGFRTLAIGKRSSEVWHLLAAVQTEFGKYNDVEDRIAKQLDTASTTVQKLGQRTRVMNNKLKKVEALPDGVDASLMLGFDAGEIEEAESEVVDDASTDSEASGPIVVRRTRRPRSSEVLPS
jgi:DNA recombination protein RmuC